MIDAKYKQGRDKQGPIPFIPDAARASQYIASGSATLRYVKSQKVKFRLVVSWGMFGQGKNRKVTISWDPLS